jgi:YVTN family beta-propeller protein
MRKLFFAALFSCALFVSPLFATDSGSGYHLIKKVTIGGEGGWDYLTADADARRIYISHGTHVQVVDADNYSVVGDIPDTPGVHGIAVVPSLGRGFTSNGRENTVSIFDLKTLKLIQKVSVGQNPDAIIFDPASGHVFTFNGRSKDATVVDPSKGTVIATIPLGAKPEFAAADGKGKIFVNLEDTSALAKIDSRQNKVEATYDLKPCQEPSGLAMDREHRRIFSGCDNKMMAVTNADTGKVITTLPIGEGVDANGFDPATALVFSSNGEAATLTVVHEDSPNQYKVLDNVKTEKGARTMALDEKTHNVFLVTAKRGPAPLATSDNPRPRPSVIPGSFVLLVYGK